MHTSLFMFGFEADWQGYLKKFSFLYVQAKVSIRMLLLCSAIQSYARREGHECIKPFIA